LGTVIVIAAVLLTLSNQTPNPPASTAASPTTASAGEPTYPEVERVSLEDSKAAYDQGTAVFLDVRSTSSYSQGHIPGALSIPLGELQDRTSELNPDDWIITYCT